MVLGLVGFLSYLGRALGNRSCQAGTRSAARRSSSTTSRHRRDAWGGSVAAERAIPAETMIFYAIQNLLLFLTKRRNYSFRG